MRMDRFRMERTQSLYENVVKWNLSESFSMSEFPHWRVQVHTSAISRTLVAGLDQLHDLVSVLRSQSNLRKADPIVACAAVTRHADAKSPPRRAPDARSYRDQEHAKENAGAVFSAPA